MKRSIPFSDLSAVNGAAPSRFIAVRRAEIEQRLKTLGAVLYDLALPEAKALPLVLDPHESLGGIVFGHYSEGRGALIVTNRRILFLDKKPLFVRYEEVTHDSVTGVSYTKAGLGGTVVLKTKAGDFSIRTFNNRCAQSFLKAVEKVAFTPERRAP